MILQANGHISVTSRLSICATIARSCHRILYETEGKVGLLWRVNDLIIRAHEFQINGIIPIISGLIAKEIGNRREVTLRNIHLHSRVFEGQSVAMILHHHNGFHLRLIAFEHKFAVPYDGFTL